MTIQRQDYKTIQSSLSSLPCKELRAPQSGSEVVSEYPVPRDTSGSTVASKN